MRRRPARGSSGNRIPTEKPSGVPAENDCGRFKMTRRKATQLDLPVGGTWGGARPGAGRKRSGGGAGPSHLPRAGHDARHPVHVTLRASPSVPSLRTKATFSVLARAINASIRVSFRVTHFSVQMDHLHLIVEADSSAALRRGLQGLTIRCAKAINRSIGRAGRVWSHRYHTHSLDSPTEVRRAVAYVLLNFRKHLRAAAGVDPRSSGVWFDGWTDPLPMPPTPRLVALSHTWLGAVGWRRAGGTLDVHEMVSRRARAARP
jgi:putative transposase